MGNVLVAQMLYLANEDPEADITLYINSPGGSVSAGMAIYDTMQFIPCDVSTCVEIKFRATHHRRDVVAVTET